MKYAEIYKYSWRISSITLFIIVLKYIENNGFMGRI